MKNNNLISGQILIRRSFYNALFSRPELTIEEISKKTHDGLTLGNYHWNPIEFKSEEEIIIEGLGLEYIDLKKDNNIWRLYQPLIKENLIEFERCELLN